MTNEKFNKEAELKKITDLRDQYEKTFKASKEKYLKVKADMSGDDGDGPDMEDLLDQMYEMCDSLWNYSYDLSNRIYRVYQYVDAQMSDHCKGHLPSIAGAGKMNNVLKKLGMDEDYQVVAPAIYARASIGGKTIDIHSKDKNK